MESSCRTFEVQINDMFKMCVSSSHKLGDVLSILIIVVRSEGLNEIKDRIKRNGFTISLLVIFLNQ